MIGSIGTDDARQALTRLTEADDLATTEAATSAPRDFDEIRKRNA